MQNIFCDESLLKGSAFHEKEFPGYRGAAEQLEEELNELRGIDEVVSRAILEKEKIVADNQIMLSILARDKEAYYARANEIIEQLAYL